MKRLKYVLLLLTVGLLILAGCSDEEEFPMFSLSEVGSLPLEETETPIHYFVNPSRARDQVIIARNEVVSPHNFSMSEEMYDLDHVTITDEEIILEYEGQMVTFTRLSESVVENEDKVRYQYLDHTTK